MWYDQEKLSSLGVTLASEAERVPEFKAKNQQPGTSCERDSLTMTYVVVKKKQLCAQAVSAELLLSVLHTTPKCKTQFTPTKSIQPRKHDNRHRKKRCKAEVASNNA